MTESTDFQTRAARHTCHAIDCDVRVPPRMFMCKKHWFTLPKELRDAVWAAYEPGQEVRMDPTGEYLNVAARAVRWLGVKEGTFEPRAV